MTSSDHGAHHLPSVPRSLTLNDQLRMTSTSRHRIIDPHVHLWDPRTTPRQVSPLVRLFGRWPSLVERLARMATPQPLVDFVGATDYVLNAHLPADFRADVGHHDVQGIVHVEADWSARGVLGPVGETRWLDRLDDPPLAIVGHAVIDDAATLEAQLDGHSAASGRLRGIRDSMAAHPDERVHSWTEASRLGSDETRAGVAALGERQLTFEAWCYSNQLDELADLAADVPMTSIMLDHIGTPVGVGGPYGGVGETAAERERICDAWYAGLERVAANPNVHCKLSGLLMPICGFGYHERRAGGDAPSHAEVVDALAPHILQAISTFGPERCMFASNFPMDKVSISYEQLFDVFFEIAGSAGLSPEQEAALFADNAVAFYRLVDTERPPDDGTGPASSSS